LNVNETGKRELLTLVDALCEETASAADIARLQELVLSNPELRRLYVEAIELHGLLYWDAAGLGAELETSGISQALTDPSSSTQVSAKPRIAVGSSSVSGPRSGMNFPNSGRLRGIACGLAVLVILKLSFGLLSPVGPQLAQGPGVPDGQLIKEREALEPLPVTPPVPDVRLTRRAPAEATATPGAPSAVKESVAATNPTAVPSDYVLTTDEAMIARINSRLRTEWELAEVTPAPHASDPEWLRRIYLDLAGRIPTTAEAEAFFQNSSGDKRTELVRTLTDSREFARHFATTWTNLLVGRSREMNIDRESLLLWMEREFASRQPWRETVVELVAARGSATESGPANFLLAHLNNEAVPATAITARILLCEQLQCTQCHQHPTVKSWGQERFWELNAFFQQAQIRESQQFASDGSRMMVRELVDAEEFGPTYYETLRGVMRVAYPKFSGVEVTEHPDDENASLRQQLAELLFADSRPQPARAFVNRTWAMLMGAGFTFPIDDMGPHTPVSHPELLEDLTAAFVQSHYDVHRLVRWICQSDAYQLSSRSSHQQPDEDAGDRPLFAQMKVKSLSAEQMFDSLKIASGVTPVELMDSSNHRSRENWLKQFYSAIDTEENSEASTFDGSLPQVLMMMNGDLVNQATSFQKGLILSRVAAPNNGSEAEQIRQLSLAALSRYPSQDELNQLRDLLRRSIRQRVNEENLPPQLALAEGLKDMYWAYLNSSEFSNNH